jgi:hypothetical protein
MYNLLVTGVDGSWDAGTYNCDVSRFLEYTDDETSEKFKALLPSQIDALKALPCLFCYEGTQNFARVGRLTDIKVRGREIRIRFEFSGGINPIPFRNIEPISAQLDIRKWEMNRTHWAVKDEDLLRHLRSLGLIPISYSDPESPAGIQQAAEVAAPDHVSSVKQFIERVLQKNTKNNEMFYRGHSNAAKYKLEPSLFRKDADGNYLYLDNEHTLYRELLVSNSIDFHNDNYTLDRLVRMQHYSLPTRLLDVTSNPLIALYFACKSNVEDIGEVITFAVDRDKLKYFDSDTVSCIANLARMIKKEKDDIDFGIGNNKDFNNQSSIKRLLHFIKEEKSFFEPRILKEHLRSIVCVKGKRSNDRITSQSGAFFLFGLDAVLDEHGSPEIDIKRISVTNKVQVLKDLDLLNINESTVFPYIETSAKYVAKKYSFQKPNPPA